MNQRLERWGTSLIWHPSNIYPTAQIGERVRVGMFTEIGPVAIGNDVTIGAHCFICEGVTIEDRAWIGPKVTFTNDRYPPSKKEEWEKTVVKQGARIGAAVTILCGVTIGQNAVVGCGSVVTKDIPAGETWAGNPAKPLLKRGRKNGSAKNIRRSP